MKILKKVSMHFIGSPSPRGKKGCRAYAVGDIHGRLDLLDDILERLDQDIRSREPRKNYIIFLGDLIDRGPASAQVVERLRSFQPSNATPIFLMGNHEEILLRLLAGEKGLLTSWLKFGGAECAISYDLDPERLRSLDEEAALSKIREQVPASHVQFLKSFGDTFAFGDYLFVHAGIRPGLHLADQVQADLRWIREPFLSDNKEHGCVVVHGHTIFPSAQERKNRIGIDTGAYKSGVLTSLAVEGEKRWFLATSSSGELASQSAEALERRALV